MDALFVNQLDSSISIYWGNPDFIFSDPTTLPILRSGNRPLIQDINLDGTNDLLLIHRDLSKISTLLQTDKRSFSDPKEYPQTPPFEEIVLFDIDADGDIDIFGKQQGSTPQGEVLEWYGFREQKEGVFLPQEYLGEDNGAVSVPVAQEKGLYRIEEQTLYFQKFHNRKLEGRKKQTSVPFPSKEISALTSFGGLPQGPVLLRTKDQVYYYYLWNHEDWCLLYSSPNLIHDINDWNKDGILDLLYSKTCAGCTSNHMLAVGIPE
jgi:hypothetical protein